MYTQNLCALNALRVRFALLYYIIYGFKKNQNERKLQRFVLLCLCPYAYYNSVGSHWLRWSVG